MRIALLMNLAPRKLGSMEAWIIAFCKEAIWRGHQVDIYGRAPVHPAFSQDLVALGVGWGRVDELERNPRAAVRTLSRYDALHLNLLAPRSKAALAAYAAYPASVLYVAHSDHLPPPPGESTGRRLARVALDRLTRIRMDSLAGVSTYVREKERKRFGLSPLCCRTIYNGIDVDRFKPLPERPPGRGVHLLTVAYFQPHKGVHHLLNAFAHVKAPDARLTIAGDGPELERLQEQAKALGVSSRVDFPGLRDDVPALLRQADLFVHSSLAEAFGLTIGEAMATGLPIVASRVGGVPEVIEEGQSGLLVAPGDEAGLAEAINTLIASPELRQRLGENARARVRQRFHLRGSVVQHVDWCEETFAQRSRVRAAVLRLRPPARPATSIPVHPTPHWGPIPAAPEVGTPASKRRREAELGASEQHP